MSSLVHTGELRTSSQDKLLTMIRAKRPNYHPVLAMVDLAHEVDHDGEDGDRALAFACHKEVAKYVVQVDRMTEIKQETVKTKRVIVELFGQDQQALENQQQQVLAAGAVVDAEVKRTVIQERGPVEENEPEDATRPQSFSRYLDASGDADDRASSDVALGLAERMS